jgi:hypothetical protein
MPGNAIPPRPERRGFPGAFPVIKDQYVAPGTAAQEVREAAEVLRASGLTVEADDVR